ncbi:Ca2+-binding protein [Commensalibacter communis]|uniref:hypothetical protein n=1 Tax=Commensalibacter communis TaxID=2972786 RepID=UPI0022FFAD0B|nr:hypothetical protein [Commensalibacter communis]CAI3950063.1 Ca2+-binding protein [Commensalibacter communis]
MRRNTSAQLVENANSDSEKLVNFVFLQSTTNAITFTTSVNNITIGDSNTNLTLDDDNYYILFGNGNNKLQIGNGDNEIQVGDGNNNILTGYGSNRITLGMGNNSLTLNGTDTVYSYGDYKPNAYNYVTINGGHSNINISNQAYVYDMSNPVNDPASGNINNYIYVGSNSHVIGGQQNYISFLGNTTNESDPSKISKSVLKNTYNSTIGSAYDNLVVSGGHNNDFYYIGKDFSFSGGTGNTNVFHVEGQVNIKGSDGLNMTINSYNAQSNIFTAQDGNETLNAAGSTGAFGIYANTVSGSRSSLVAVGGRGDDTLTAGVGNSTFTGGAGSNLFAFTSSDVANGSTVITDFLASEDNQIALFNYGLNRSSLSALLKNSQNDVNGDAVLNLGNHEIIIQGGSVSDLHPSQFIVYNSKA